MSYAERLAPYLGPSKHELAKLERAEQDLAGGDKGAILRAVFICAGNHMAMPDWLREAFMSAYQKAKKPRAKWDDVFGTPRKKNLKSHQVEVRGRLAPMIWVTIRDLRAKHPRKDHFHDVANQFGISEATCRNYFRRMEKAVAVMFAKDPKEDPAEASAIKSIIIEKWRQSCKNFKK